MDTKKLYKTDFDNIVWQEVFDNGVRLDRNITIIEVWKNFGNGWKDELRKVSMAHGERCILLKYCSKYLMQHDFRLFIFV